MIKINKAKKVVLFIALCSLTLCNIIYQNIFHILSSDGHHHSEYSIIWAPNAYMVFFLWAFYNFVPKWISLIALFMTVIGFNLVYFSSQNYPIGMGTYFSSLLMYAVNNLVFIIGFFLLIKAWSGSSVAKKYNEVISYILVHIGGAVCTLAASFSVIIFPHSSVELIYQFFAANMMAFTFFTSYLFLTEKFLPDDVNIKMMNFSLLVSLSSTVFYIVNVFFHDLSKETFALILMASFICLFIKNEIYTKILIVSFVSALFAAVNVALDLSFYDFILFYGICISTSIILIMRRKEIDFVDTLQKSVNELERSRLIDPLTGILNREGFLRCLKNFTDDRIAFLVAYADLDKFKEINDIMGHSCGDLVLQIVATRIKSVLGEDSHVARLGGDEFAFIVLGEKNSTLNVCQSILDKVKRPMMIGGAEFSIGASIGVCFSPSQETKIDALLDKADIAMFVAKRSHARTPICFEHHMDHRKSPEILNMQRAFNITKIINDCYAVYQPIHSVKDNRIFSFEALLRHPTLSTVDIINWAEEYGYMNELFEMMVIKAVKIISETGCPVTVNLSPSQLIFNGSMIESFLCNIVTEYKVPKFHLNIEITESIPILDQDLFLAIIVRIKALGIKVYLDDFGTGYAFFSTLSIGAFDAIKIDRNLVNKVNTVQSVQRLISSIISYASMSNMYVVAEGVESEVELDILKGIGVSYVQGYLFSKPLDENTVADYIKQKKLKINDK